MRKIRARCHLKEEGKKIERVLTDLGIEVFFGEDTGRFNFEMVIIENDIKALVALKKADPRAEIIVVGESEKDAIEVLRHGASAFFTHPIDSRRLKETANDIVKMYSDRQETAKLENQLYEKYTFAGLVVGKSTKMLNIFAFMRRIAPYFTNVLIAGETGTGKELAAKALHKLSTPDEPFVVCNCGGLTENLVESVLFGHKRGSFTGSISDRKGLFETAGKGCIFLDEVGELPLSFQTHFLRVLQDGEFRPLGDERTRKAKCRILAATNRDLSEEVQRGTFRKDLYYRLTPLTVTLPPLRDRKDDIHLLSRAFLERFNSRSDKKIQGISLPAREALMSHDWPGNVRELANVIDQAAIMTTTSFIRLEDLPSSLTTPQGSGSPRQESLEDMIRLHIEETMRRLGGNRTQAAKALGISRWSLIRKLEKYNLD